MFGSCLSRGYSPLLTSREAAKQTGPSKGKHIFIFYLYFLFLLFFKICLVPVCLEGTHLYWWAVKRRNRQDHPKVNIFLFFIFLFFFIFLKICLVPVCLEGTHLYWWALKRRNRQDHSKVMCTFKSHVFFE